MDRRGGGGNGSHGRGGRDGRGGSEGRGGRGRKGKGANTRNTTNSRSQAGKYRFDANSYTNERRIGALHRKQKVVKAYRQLLKKEGYGESFKYSVEGEQLESNDVSCNENEDTGTATTAVSAMDSDDYNGDDDEKGDHSVMKQSTSNKKQKQFGGKLKGAFASKQRSYKMTKEEAIKLKEEKNARIKEHEEQVLKDKKRRRDTNYKLNMRNKRGQPRLDVHMEHLLAKIKESSPTMPTK